MGVMQISIKPFKNLTVLSCMVERRPDSPPVLKFSGRIKAEMEDRYLKLAKRKLLAEVSVFPNINELEIDEIFSVLRENDVTCIMQALRKKGILDVLSVFNLKGISDVMPILHGLYREDCLEVLNSLEAYLIIKSKGIENGLEILDELKAAKFFSSWDKNLLRDCLNRDRIIFAGVVTTLAVQIENQMQILTGVIESKSYETEHIFRIPGIITVEEIS